MKAPRRQFMIGVAAAALFPACSPAAIGEALTPEAFGAKGDGRTNDTDAFAALSAHVNARGGGTIVLRKTIYIVGKQARSEGRKGQYAFVPADILHFVNCRGDISIQGNGATLRCAPGLLYGGFDRQSGRPLPDGAQNLDNGRRAVPYVAMIYTENCSGAIEIDDLELDGNLRALNIGGRAGASGWQAATTGLRLFGNSGPERLTGIHSHHHAQDGIELTAAADRSGATTVSDCICEDNGRNACSVTRGRNYSFERCAFRRSGKAGIKSAPAAGVDIEAEFGPIRNVSFSDCDFSDNKGMALVAGAGDSDGLSFAGCTFVGTDWWAAWPSKPHTKFSNCTFVGSIIHVCGDPDPSRAAQFLDCTFTDSPALSPSGKVFIDRGSIAWLTDSRNALFSRCRFRLTGQAGLPRSIGVIYTDCQMSQVSPAPSHPQGTYLGTTTITGNANLAGSDIRGTVILNGRQLPRSG